MRVVEYELAPADLIAFNTHLRSTESGRSRVLRTVVFVSLGLLCGVLVATVLGSLLFGALVALLAAVLGWVVARRDTFPGVRRDLRRLMANQAMGKPFRVSLTVEADGLRQRSDWGDTFVGWDDIRRLDESPEYVYVFFAPTRALVIPKRERPSDVERLLEALRARPQSMREAPLEQADRAGRELGGR